MTINIFQKFSFSPILYLFYNVDLLKTCNKSGKRTIIMAFVDDVNILMYDRNTKTNCYLLENVHKNCKNWAKSHEAEFAPNKYELIHLIKNLKKFNMAAILRVNGETIVLKTNIRILELQINFKLN